MPDAGTYGYYRWNIPAEMLLLLAEQPQGALSEREQVAFLGNATALLDAGVISGDTYLSILSGFARSPEPDIVASVASKLLKIRDAFIPDDLRDAFAFYIRTTFRPALNRVGLEKKDGEPAVVSALRPQLIGWLGDEGNDREIREFAKTKAREILANPAATDPSMAGVILRIAALEGDETLFQTYKSNFETAKSPVLRGLFLGALGAFSDSKLQDAALAYILEGPLHPNELFTIPRRIADTAEGRDRNFNWLLKNYDAITSRLPAEYAAFMPFSARGCSAERLEKAREFFSNPAHQVPGTMNTLQKVSESVMDCVNLRQREGTAVAAYLIKLADKQENDTQGSE